MEPNPLLPTLPLNLAMSLSSWLASPSAWRCANSDLPRSKRAEKSPQPPLENHIAEEAKNRSRELLTGVLRYLEAPYSRQVSEPPAIWRRGSARLLDYGQGACENASRVALFVPSLINRYYVLDLEEKCSMLRHFSTQGIYPLVLDWGAPGKFEADFDCDAYISKILLPAIDYIHGISGQRVALAGYCMGGLLALAAAQLKPKQISSLALLATPWDFHCKEFLPFVVDKQWQATLTSLIASRETLPADVIQALFYLTDPFVFDQKFRRFANLDLKTRAAQDFIALERWVNDGVPMTAKLARDCLIDWAQNNIVASGKWQVANKVIDPKKIKCPTFIAIPQSDHVVPLDCAMPLASALPRAHVIRPTSGHVGMIVGSKARKELWNPLVEWLRSLD